MNPFYNARNITWCIACILTFSWCFCWSRVYNQNNDKIIVWIIILKKVAIITHSGQQVIFNRINVHLPEGQRLHVFLQYACRESLRLAESHPYIFFQVEQLAPCWGSSLQTVKILSFSDFQFSYFKCFDKWKKFFKPLSYQFTRTCIIVTYFSCCWLARTISTIGFNYCFNSWFS